MIVAEAAIRRQLRGRRKPPAAPPWRPVEASGLYRGLRVLAWDATLTNCAWAVLEAAEAGAARDDEIIIHARGTLRPRTALAGYLGTWDKARQLRTGIEGVRDAVEHHQSVLEAPSVGGGSRTESSLIAGFLAWEGEHPACDVVSATHVSAVMLGDAKVRSADRKKRIREAVIALVPGAAGRDWNEHQRDAVATGITWLRDLYLRHWGEAT